MTGIYILGDIDPVCAGVIVIQHVGTRDDGGILQTANFLIIDLAQPTAVRHCFMGPGITVHDLHACHSTVARADRSHLVRLHGLASKIVSIDVGFDLNLSDRVVHPITVLLNIINDFSAGTVKCLGNHLTAVRRDHMIKIFAAVIASTDGVESPAAVILDGRLTLVAAASGIKCLRDEAFPAFGCRCFIQHAAAIIVLRRCDRTVNVVIDRSHFSTASIIDIIILTDIPGAVREIVKPRREFARLCLPQSLIFAPFPAAGG